MASVISKDLFDTNASTYVLSYLMHDPLILQNDRFTFCKDDFYKPLQQMVFYAIFNMAQLGTEKISPQDIDLYLKQYDAQYEFYKREKGYEFVMQCYQIAESEDAKLFEFYYNRLKKFSFLRDLEAIGYDTKEFYDTQANALNKDLEDERLNKTSLDAIGNRIRAHLVEIENRHIGKDDSTSQTAAKGLRHLVAELKESPEVGLPLDGEIINYAARGARLGKLYTYSAPSGQGKTRYMVGNACAISFPYIDKDSGKIIYRGTLEQDDYQKIVYIATEQKADEIQTLILAYVSGVNERNILLGSYTPEEEDRINKALDIIEKYQDNFMIEYMSDPSIAQVKTVMARYIIQHNIQYLFYDYIFSSPGLLSEFRDVEVREDVALMMLSNSIKETASNYNVFIQSATQLNENWSKKEIGPRDQNCLRGSKAIADKIDIGLIGVRLGEAEMKQIDAVLKELRAQNPIKYKRDPNIVIDIYKNRRGELNSVKVFRYFDYATCHAEDLFITDCSYKAVQEIGQLKYDQRPFDYLDLKTRGIL